MTLNRLRLLFLFILITLHFYAIGQAYQSTLNMHVSVSPEIVTIAGKKTIYYELYLSSYSSDTIQLKKLDVLSQTDSSLIYSIGKESWNTKAGLIGVNSKQNGLLPPGQSTVIYLEINLQSYTKQLYHRLEIEIKNKKGSKSLSINGGALLISKQSAVMLGAPLKGGPWAAVYSAEWERGHRRVIYTIDGKARIPGRYAIDFILLNDQGKFANADDNVIKNWFGYSADVLAVKDGIVLSIKNDFAESTTLSDHVESTPDKAAGNYISIDIGEGKIAFYEHLKPGSVRIKPGQRVKKGEVIAALGFTGQTTGPHLHLHVADANSTLGAEGLPFEFEKFTRLGTYFNFDEFGKLRWTEEKNPTSPFINKERPGPNTVIRF